MTTKTISFPSQNKVEFIVELRKKVKDYFEENNLSRYGNLRTRIKAISVLGLYIIPYLLMMTEVITSLPGMFAAWCIMGVGLAGVGMGVMHDANHGSFSKSHKINRLMSKSLYLLGGFPPTWQYQHNTLHHGFTNIDGHDEDIVPPIALLRFSPHRPLLKIHRFQYIYAWFFYGLMTFTWVTTKDFTRLARYKKDGVSINRKKYSQLLTDLVVSKILYYLIALILPLIVLPVAWYWVVLFFVTMHFVGGLILGAIFQSAHVMPTSEYPLPDDQGHLENNWAIHQLITTTDFSPKSRIFSWFIGGLNYQVEHHLFPNISHAHYKKLSQLVRSTAQEHELPYHVQYTFVGALKSHVRMLKVLGGHTPRA